MKRFAFTLVELLIVVVILGILAAVVVPQFSDASDDAQLSTLTTNLQTVRGQLELYKLQHKGKYPDLDSFVAQMTQSTDADGDTGSDFGPYLQAIPNNPYNNKNDLAATLTGETGWMYDETSGEFRANDGSHSTL